jgi:hypothetical protein
MTARTLCAFLLFPLLVFSLPASEVVQLDVRPILNGRAVTTLTGTNELVPWTKGIDGGGHADGYMTVAATVVNGDPDAHALPGDGSFAANNAHPFVKLNFSDADGKNPQVRSVTGADEFSFPVSTNRYQRMIVFMTSAEGPSHLNFTLAYADGTSAQRPILLPDYYNAPAADDTNVFCLATNLAKWNAAGRMAERDHHNIHGVDIRPDAGKVLVSVRVEKTAPGYLVFWGATGVTAD